MNSPKTVKVCCVCGDRALAKHFCALTCESCRAFFRRNASNLEQFRCSFGDKCVVSIDTRKRCQKCRLKKCFDVGMRKEWILDETEKMERNMKREENRKRRLQNLSIDSQSSQSTNSWDNNNNYIHSDDNYSILEHNLTSVEKTGEEYLFDDSSVHQYLRDYQFITDTIESNADNSVIDGSESSDSRDTLASAAQYTELVVIDKHQYNYSDSLKEIESSFVVDLLEATKNLSSNQSNVTFEIKSLVEGMRWMSVYWDREVRQIIKTATALTAFTSLSEEDKLFMLKHASVEITFLRSVCHIHFDHEHQALYWYIYLDDSSTAIINLKVFEQRSVDNYHSYKLFFSRLVQELENDSSILNLLFAIVLFNPNRSGIINRPLIRLQQYVYINLLKRYLRVKYGSESESLERFGRIMNILNDLHDIHERYIRSYFDEQPEYSHTFMSHSPLLKEIYDR